MTFVHMNSAQFYQPPIMADPCSDGRPAASDFRLSTARAKGNNPRALGPSKGSSRTLQNYDLIEIFNLTGLLPEEPLNPFHAPASGLDSTQRNVGGTVLCPCN